MQKRTHFFLTLLCGLFLTMSAWANCPVTLKVVSKQADIILGKGGEIPQTHSVILMPMDQIGSSEPCKAYVEAKQFRMNNVEQHDQNFQDLEQGDIITGTLNYHRPSPFGKMLYDNYHHGFRLLSKEQEDFSQEYIYFRHIGVFLQDK